LSLKKVRAKKPDRSMSRVTQYASASLWDKVQSAVLEYDKAATIYEERWGRDRLADLSGPELRERFYQQIHRMNQAISAVDHREVAHQVSVTLRGYAALEAAALEAGHKPLEGRFWDAPMPDGRVLCVCPDHHEAGKVAQQRKGENVLVYSVEEIANILATNEAAKAVDIVKAAFPGATVTGSRKAEVYDDDIPF
jgi:hypothetical protein